MTVTFKPATSADKPMIQQWWTAPHVMEFWDNSDEMWQNVENYLDHGVKDLFDFMIGNEDMLGKGLAAPTLKAFIDFCPKKITRFLIDPAIKNKRAVHVYAQAGFKEVGRWAPEAGSFAGQEHFMMQCDRLI